jgi:two-component system, LytTR family, sensor kinase
VATNAQRREDAKARSKAALFWLLHCGGWGAFGAAMAAWGLSYWAVDDVLANKAVLVATGFLLTLGLRLVYRATRTRGLHALTEAATAVALSFGGAAVWVETQYVVLTVYHYGAAAARLVAIQPGTLLYHGFVLLAWSLLYYGVNAWFDLEAERERALRAEALAHEARLRALRSQLEPHFLFNTLNAVSTLVVEGKNPAAVRMLARLGDFLRLTLDAVDRPEIQVAEELEFVRRYLEIEQVRFGDRLRATVTADADAMSALVPALVLQPLVENAVKHGVLPREEGGALEVRVEVADGMLRLSVADDGPGLTGEEAPASGVGLANTSARLAELYGERARLSLGRSPEGGLLATIELPVRHAPAAEGARV